MASVQYRQVQIFVKLTNICFSRNVLPVFQFNGALLLITFLYSTIEFGKYLPIWTTVLLGLCSLLLITLVWVVLDQGSQPVLQSSKVLKNWKRYNVSCNCRWTRKFIRSCPKVVLRMGSFHAVDQSRAPNLMRFVLQRTFFLVKSFRDLSVVTISLPS